MYSLCCAVYGHISKRGLFYLKSAMEVWFFEHIHLNVGKFVLSVFIRSELFQSMSERAPHSELDTSRSSEKSEFYLKCCMDVLGSSAAFEDLVHN